MKTYSSIKTFPSVNNSSQPQGRAAGQRSDASALTKYKPDLKSKQAGKVQERRWKQAAVHTDVEGVGDMSAIKLQSHQVAGLGIMSQPEGHAQDHTSCKLPQQEQTVASAKLFVVQEIHSTSIQTISMDIVFKYFSQVKK